MALQSDCRTAVLLVVVGVALVWTAIGTGGPETSVVREYTAYEVEYADDELRVTSVETGETRNGRQAERVNVDEGIACLPALTRQCGFERRAIEGEISGEGIGSDYRYAYVDGEFYRITGNGTIGFEHERTAADDAFAELAVDRDRLTGDEREALAEGRVVSARPLPHANRLVRKEGRYYTLLNTGLKSYGEGGSFCSSSGDGFCRDADAHRRGIWLRTVTSGFLGVLAIAFGGRDLLEAWRSKYGSRRR